MNASLISNSLTKNRISLCFSRLRDNNRKALIPFITAGDPALEATLPIMHALVASGADIIELGVPFSDPMADGPTIQRSSERALERGANLDYILRTVAAFRENDTTTPIVLMGYLNPVEIRGPARFAQAAANAGVDGVLLVDLPTEETTTTANALNTAGLALILLAAPTTSQERLQILCNNAQGYLYYVNFAGVTGASTRLDSTTAGARLQLLRKQSSVPVVAGFGITDASSACKLAAEADGVVIGSALVSALANSTDPVQAAQEFIQPLRQALDTNIVKTK